MQDSRAFFIVTGLPTVTGNGTKQIRISVATIAATGKPLILNALGGDDSLMQFGAETAFDTAGFRFLGGQGNNKLSFDNFINLLVWKLSASGTGTVTPAGQASRFISSIEHLHGSEGADQFRLAAGDQNPLLKKTATVVWT